MSGCRMGYFLLRFKAARNQGVSEEQFVAGIVWLILGCTRHHAGYEACAPACSRIQNSIIISIHTISP